MKKMFFLLVMLLLFASPVMGAIEKASIDNMVGDSKVMQSEDMKDARSMMGDIILILLVVFVAVVAVSIIISGAGLSVSGWAHALAVRAGGATGLLYAIGSVILVILAFIIIAYFYNTYIAG